MRATIDQEGCIGCGMCEQTSPEVFVLNGAVAEVTCDPVAPENEGETREAASMCPVNVIHLDD